MKAELLSLFIALTSCAFAQKSFFAVDAGVNVATQRVVSPYPGSASSSIMFFNNVVKPTFGFFYQYRVLDKISLRANAQYMALGAKGGFFYAHDLNINYLTFPVTVHYQVTKNLSLNTGGYLSFTIANTNLNDQPITSTYHKNDFGFSFGGERDMCKNFSLGVNYYVGLKNIWLADQGGSIKYTNRVLQFTLIYKFRKPI